MRRERKRKRKRAERERWTRSARVDILGFIRCSFVSISLLFSLSLLHFFLLSRASQLTVHVAFRPRGCVCLFCQTSSRSKESSDRSSSEECVCSCSSFSVILFSQLSLAFLSLYFSPLGYTPHRSHTTG